MEQVWLVAALWLVLALVATLLSRWFRISTALSEIVVGTVAQLIIGALIGTQALRIQYYFSDGECPLVEEIEDVPNDVVRAFLDLFVLGKLKFAIDDVRGLNVYWFPRLDGRSVH